MSSSSTQALSSPSVFFHRHLDRNYWDMIIHFLDLESAVYLNIAFVGKQLLRNYVQQNRGIFKTMQQRVFFKCLDQAEQEIKKSVDDLAEAMEKATRPSKLAVLKRPEWQAVLASFFWLLPVGLGLLARKSYDNQEQNNIAGMRTENVHILDEIEAKMPRDVRKHWFSNVFNQDHCAEDSKICSCNYLKLLRCDYSLCEDIILKILPDLWLKFIEGCNSLNTAQNDRINSSSIWLDFLLNVGLILVGIWSFYVIQTSRNQYIDSRTDAIKDAIWEREFNLAFLSEKSALKLNEKNFGSIPLFQHILISLERKIPHQEEKNAQAFTQSVMHMHHYVRKKRWKISDDLGRLMLHGDSCMFFFKLSRKNQASKQKTAIEELKVSPSN